MEEKQKSNERILHVENGSFTPLVFSINGGIEKKSQYILLLDRRKIS